jgi:ParB/RepB/Spo0J family partition protein
MSTAARKTRADVPASAPPPATQPAGRFELIDLDLIEPSRTNFRKEFDPELLRELAESVREKGVVEPVIVRPVPPEAVVVEPGRQGGAEGWFVYDSRHFDQTRKTVEYLQFFPTKAEAQRHAPRYELVAGERRWRAAKMAELESIPAVVREYSDRAALEVQIIENDQRADISPMERARGFRVMLDELGYSADEIAAKLHKSKTFVYSHLKLAGLPKVAVEALEKGTEAGGISRSVAELVARIPDPKAQEKAALKVVKGEYGSGPMSFRDAKRYVEREFMKELKGAPFSLDDEQLFPEMGSCTKCPYRSGNTPEQYQGKRPDICLAPSCFAKKVEAFKSRTLESAREKGYQVLTGKEATAALSFWNSSCPYVGLERQNHDDPKGRTWRKLLDKKEPGEIYVAQEGDGQIHHLYPRDKAVKEVKEKHGISTRSSSAGGSYAREEAKRKERTKRRKEVAGAAIRQAFDKSLDAFKGAVVNSAQGRQIRAMLGVWIGNVDKDVQRLVVRARGLEPVRSKNSWGSGDHEDFERALLQLADGLTATQQLALLAEVSAAQQLYSYACYSYNDAGLGKADKEFFSSFGLDVAAIEKEHFARHAAAERAKKALKAPAKKSARAAAGRGR